MEILSLSGDYLYYFFDAYHHRLCGATQVISTLIDFSGSFIQSYDSYRNYKYTN